MYSIIWRHLKKKKQKQKLFADSTHSSWSALRVISQLEHIKFTVINSLRWEPMVNIDVWSFICDVAHGALFVCCCCCSLWAHYTVCEGVVGQVDRDIALVSAAGLNCSCIQNKGIAWILEVGLYDTAIHSVLPAGDGCGHPTSLVKQAEV